MSYAQVMGNHVFEGNSWQHAQNYAQTHPAFVAPETASDDMSQGRADDPQFDIFEWHPKYVSCQKYFLDHAQHSAPVQAMAAFINIHLPCQRTPAVMSSNPPNPAAAAAAAAAASAASGRSPSTHNSSSRATASASNPAPPNFAAASTDPPSTSLFPYLRRLVVTGLDFPGVLHGFFGDDWSAGIGPLHEQERRNLLFAAKSGGWTKVKKDYDNGPLETVPFLRPLQQAVETEIVAAERSWSEWLAMEDWMVGPRAPQETGEASGETRMMGTERVGEGFAS